MTLFQALDMLRDEIKTVTRSIKTYERVVARFSII